MFTLIILCGIAYITYKICKNKDTDDQTETVQKRQPRQFDTDSVPFDGKYQSTFNDIQEVQIEAAIANGIEPMGTANPDSIRMLLDKGELVEVKNGLLYEISEVSLPYLTPDAWDLLNAIAIKYQQYEGIGNRLRLTSCLRTDETISKLMRGNRNSVKNSCHLYGTTFDISYRFLEPKAKRSLAQVLYEMQQAGHCYVKYERKQPCFHVTVR